MLQAEMRRGKRCRTQVWTAGSGCSAEQSSAVGTFRLSDVVHVRFLRCETTGELRSPGQPGAAVPT